MGQKFRVLYYLQGSVDQGVGWGQWGVGIGTRVCQKIPKFCVFTEIQLFFVSLNIPLVVATFIFQSLRRQILTAFKKFFPCFYVGMDFQCSLFCFFFAYITLCLYDPIDSDSGSGSDSDQENVASGSNASGSESDQDERDDAGKPSNKELFGDDSEDEGASHHSGSDNHSEGSDNRSEASEHSDHEDNDPSDVDQHSGSETRNDNDDEDDGHRSDGGSHHSEAEGSEKAHSDDEKWGREDKSDQSDDEKIQNSDDEERAQGSDEDKLHQMLLGVMCNYNFSFSVPAFCPFHPLSEVPEYLLRSPASLHS